jgi:hypothetical protein
MSHVALQLDIVQAPRQQKNKRKLASASRKANKRKRK